MHTFFGRSAPPWEEDPFIKIRFTGEHVKELLIAAKINLPAWMAAKELAGRLLEQKNQIPDDLQSFLVEMDRKMPKAKKGRNSHEKLFRDFHIVLLLNSVEDSGLPVTRNPDPMYAKENSRCDAMKLALESIGISLSYEAIRSIWYKKEKLKNVFKEFPSPFNPLKNNNLSVLNK